MKELFDAITVLKARNNPENWDDVLRVQRAADAIQQQLAAAREAMQAAEADAARYRWLRKRTSVSMMMLANDVAPCDMNSEPYMTDGIDSYIDNCIATLQRDRQP